MKKILLLTTIYPSEDLNLLNNTNVCHYFAKEWVQKGNQVKVIFNYPIYLRILHFIAKIFEKTIASYGSAYITTKRVSKDKQYSLDGVIVERFPLYKPLPKMKISKKNIKKQINKIIESNANDNFKPDIIVAHFFYPHLEMVVKLKEYYSAKSAIIVHHQKLNLEKIYRKDYKKLIQKIDTWGFRSIILKSTFEDKYGVQPKTFICHSGVPKMFLDHKIEKKIPTKINNFVYVGSLIKRKHPDAILYGLKKYFKSNEKFNLSIVGSGKLENSLKKIVKKNNLSDNVTFHGFLSRNEVSNILQKQECFIMISENETFGLVYLEAMANGCITIASKNEGMEGIIKNGINGFLCTAGDHDELASIIEYINSLPQAKLKEISQNAQQTATNLNDQYTAILYLNNII